jgi:hypothetical protein
MAAPDAWTIMVNKTGPSRDVPTRTFGVLTAGFNVTKEISLWHGTAERARERRTHLIVFSGGIPHSSQLYEDKRNILFNFAGLPNLDGLLVWANILSLPAEAMSVVDEARRSRPTPGQIQLTLGSCSSGERAGRLARPPPLSAIFDLIRPG